MAESRGTALPAAALAPAPAAAAPSVRGIGIRVRLFAAFAAGLPALYAVWMPRSRI